MNRVTHICWILACLVLATMVIYEFWAPCGLRAFERDIEKWAARGCVIEYSPKDTWRNLFNREPTPER